MKANQLSILAMASVFLIPVSLFAQSSVNIGYAPGYPGATLSVPVIIRQPAAIAVGAQFEVAFNAGKVSALDVLRGEQLTNHVIRSRQVAPGVERVLIYSLAGAPVPGTNVTIARLPFTVSPTEFIGSGPITPANVVLARADATSVIPVSANAGAIFVRQVNPLPDGQVQFFLPSTPDQRYAIQATTNLVEWSNISTNLATGDFMNLLDVEAGRYPYRFYRWESIGP